jgi:hypothetical protein
MSSYFFEKIDHNICFLRKSQIFHRNLETIAEHYDRNIDPCFDPGARNGVLCGSLLSHLVTKEIFFLEPIQRLLNVQLQRQRCT